MQWLSNVSIRTKLAIMSGIGVALVAAIIGSVVWGNATVSTANENVIRRADLARAILTARIELRGMEVAARDVRLANTAAELAQAITRLDALRTAAHLSLDRAIEQSSLPKTLQILQTTKQEVNQYTARAKDVGAIMTEIFALQAKPAQGAADKADAASQIAAREQRASGIARDVALPIAAKMEEAIHKLADGVNGRMIGNAAQSRQAMALSERVSAVVAIMAILALIGQTVFSAIGIARPLRALVAPLEEVADGNFAISVPGTGRRDEVGQIAEAVAQMAQRVSGTIGEIKASGREVTNASAEISTSTTDLSQRTEEQAASLEETSAAMEELSATVRKNAENAQLANSDANTTREVADRGGKVVAQAVEAMAKIEDSSRRISDIIGVIDEIARQTNLLALNAAVEAARAGEAGRGFAVVASEVRSLAQRSSQAAKDIKDLINNSNGQVKDGVELVNKAGESLTEIVESIKKVAAVVSDIANASIEQATGIEQINKALNQMDEATQQNSALVEENAATAKTLEHQAKAMDQQVAFFQIAVGDDSHAFGGTASYGHHSAPTFKPAPRKAARSAIAAKPSEPARRVAASAGPARNIQTALAKAVNGDDWKEF
jgi:methyl-accepting chemotaxis protein